MSAFSIFADDRLLAHGTLADVAVAAKAAQSSAAPMLIFDATGRTLDLDLRGTRDEVAARHTELAPESEARGRGRPKLGVVAREVTLLPRHWEWLASQRGGASSALRRPVDDARRADGGETDRAAARDAAYRFMSTISGDRENFEEAIRALFAGDAQKFARLIATWPDDIKAHTQRLAAPWFATKATSASPTPA